MAPYSESSHSFQKLRIDTSAPQKPVASTFASIPRHPPQKDSNVSSYLTSPELAGSNSPPYSDGYEGSHNGVTHGRGHAGAIGFDNLESSFRRRGTSISFDKEVTLDSGNRLSIQDPLPKPAIPETLAEEEFSETDSSKAASFQPRHIQRRNETSGYPFPTSGASGSAAECAIEDRDNVASLTSGATASPPFEEVRTPLDPSIEYLLSPFPATSPIELPHSFSRRYGSQRSRSYRSDMADIDGNGRKSRRSSTRSGRSLSSMSPAASFLSKYKTTDGPLKPTEPDDEGQGIGYEGEYIIGKQIGYGGFSVVKEVTTIEHGGRVVHAVKIVRKNLKDKSEFENEQIQTQFDHEVEIWRFLKHPYVLPLFRVYNTDFATFCITKLNKGGTLFDLVREARRKNKKGLPLHVVRRYVYQLASAIRYLHNDVLIVHRDIKLENCLIDMTGPNAGTEGGDVLLCDFGMADFIISDHRDGYEEHSQASNQNIGPADTSTSVAGSLQYAAPELFNAPGPMFSTAADIWALGVVIYAVFTAQLPFNEGLDAKTTMRILKGDWDVEQLRSAEALKNGAEDAIALVRGCLDMAPERRWTINEILTCRWLEGCIDLYENVTRPWLAGS